MQPESEQSEWRVTPVPYSLGQGSWKRAYATVTEVLLMLAEGQLILTSDLTGSGRMSGEFVDYLSDRLVAAKLAFRDDGEAVTLRQRDAQLLKSTWRSERALCALGGWEPDDALHVVPMRRLLGRNGSEREQAATIASLYPRLGQNNLCRRMGVAPIYISRMRHLAALPGWMQDMIEDHPHASSRLMEVDPNWSADQLGAWLGLGPDNGTPADEPAVEADDDVSAREMLATCVKLAAATASMVSDMSRKLDWLANELGYGDKR